MTIDKVVYISINITCSEIYVFLLDDLIIDWWSMHFISVFNI